MLAAKLMRLVEKHAEALSRGLTEQVLQSDRTSDFHKIPSKDLRLAGAEVYRNLGEWLLQKTEIDVADRFKGAASRRAAQGIRLHQFVWALMLSRDHLWYFLCREAFADSIVELHAQMELQQLLNQFFDRAIYYAVLGYEEAVQQSNTRGDLARARELATAIGLMSPKTATREISGS